MASAMGFGKKADATAEATGQQSKDGLFFDFSQHQAGLRTRNRELASGKNILKTLRSDLKKVGGFPNFTRRNEIAHEMKDEMKAKGVFKDDKITRGEMRDIEKNLKKKGMISTPQYRKMVKKTGTRSPLLPF